MFLDRLRARLPGLVYVAPIAMAGLWPIGHSAAQTAGAPAGAASSAELTPAERAKRDGDKVFHWIMIHGDKARKPSAAAATAKEDKPPVVVRAKAAPRAPERGDEPATLGSGASTAPAVAQHPTPPPTTATAPTPTPEPAAAPAAATETAARAAPPNLASATMAAPPPVAAAAPEDVVETLVPVSQEAPRFPINLVRTLRTGQVQVKFTVLPDGSVAEPAVLDSSNARLNAAALAAVARWRFAPVRKPQHGVVDLGFNETN